MNELPASVRIRVADLLKERGMSTQDFADRTGFSYNTALSLVRDNYGRIGLDTLAKVCEALGVQPGDVFEYIEDKKQ